VTGSVKAFQDLERSLVRDPEMPFGPVVSAEELLVGVDEGTPKAITRPRSILRRSYERVSFDGEVVESQGLAVHSGRAP
jgi:hypothetical protein